MPDPDYIADCTECGLSEDGDDYESVYEFKEKHEEHTDHDVEWTATQGYDFEAVDLYEHEVYCGACEEVWTYMSEEDAEEFADEHEKFTEHSRPAVTAHEFEFDEKTNSRRSLLALIEKLSGQFSDGVPHRAVIGQAEEMGIPVPEVENEITILKASGEVYEPSTKHYRPT